MKLSSLFNMSKNLFSGPSDPVAPVATDADAEAPAFERDDQVVAQMAGRRYCHLLTAENADQLDDATAATAWMALEEDMSMVLGGVLDGQASQGAAGDVVVAPFYLDRYAVTNADFAHFVNAGAYSEMELWPKEIWSNVLQFVDSTGLSGPRFWSNGRPPKQQEKHPVVGVSWYEANAYATWVGKKLPSSAEWEQAGSWPSGLDGRSGKVRYPWGNSFDPARANTWIGGPGKTVAVDEYYNGCTPNGIYQLVGNVWEWVATPYTCRTGQGGLTVEVDQPMGEIRGGAFDTYFETQATCQFRTGQPLLYRGANVGFRCCVDAAQLRQPPQPTAFV